MTAYTYRTITAVNNTPHADMKLSYRIIFNRIEINTGVAVFIII